MVVAMFFEVAGISIPIWLPPLVAFVVSFFGAMVGISGGVLLLPFQMSVLGWVAPSVSATNLVFNVVAIPGGVWRYARERRMDWRLAWVIGTGTLPGLLVGWWLRVHWLLDPRLFKFFVGLLLFLLAVRLLRKRSRAGHEGSAADAAGGAWSAMSVVQVALVIGVIGGAYGLGGGAFMAPVLVAMLRLPIHAVAGATLFGTLVTSVAGVMLYQFLPAPPGVETRPDWVLGILFGTGGLAGMYAGARMQKHLHQRALEYGMATVLSLLAGGYAVEFCVN
jgi:uncharacterized membrane protein YfcA